MAYGSSGEEDIERIIRSILSRHSKGMEFKELREYLEQVGIYVDGYILRKIIADMIRSGVLCKEILSNKRRFVLKLCM